MTTLNANADTRGKSGCAVSMMNMFGPSPMLHTLATNDPVLLREVVQIFLQQEPHQRRTILRAILRRDRNQLMTAAHSLRGSLCIFGAETANRLAEQIEAASETIDFCDAHDLFEDLEREMIVLTRSLRSAISVFFT